MMFARDTRCQTTVPHWIRSGWGVWDNNNTPCYSLLCGLVGRYWSLLNTQEIDGYEDQGVSYNQKYDG